MRGLMNRIDRFCITHPRFGIPNLMRYILIGNAAVWMFSMMDTTGLFRNALYLNPAAVMNGQVWRIFTFALVPQTSGFWVVFELYFYYFIGTALQHEWGDGKFTIYYLSGLVLTALYTIVVYLVMDFNIITTASYLHLSMFFTFAALYPNHIVIFMFILPVKIKWLALIDAAYFFRAVIANRFPMNLIPVVAVLNFVIFCGGDLLYALGVGVKAKTSPTRMDFKREAQKINREQKKAGYTRKCAVCGRTDTDYPDLEFRYCSKCEGFHCFCEDHINNHVHFKE